MKESPLKKYFIKSALTTNGAGSDMAAERMEGPKLETPSGDLEGRRRSHVERMNQRREGNYLDGPGQRDSRTPDEIEAENKLMEEMRRAKALGFDDRSKEMIEAGHMYDDKGFIVKDPELMRKQHIENERKRLDEEHAAYKESQRKKDRIMGPEQPDGTYLNK